jgi:Golgi SNAP receptor complex protein 1
MTEFARLAAQASTSYSSHGHVTEAQKTAYASLEAEISQGLLRLEELCSQMHDLLSADASSSMQHTLERHRDILQDYSRDFKRTAKSYTEAEQRANLLGSVRSEIDAFKASTSRASGGGRDGDTDQLLGERGHIDSSHRMADDVLG